MAVLNVLFSKQFLTYDYFLQAYKLLYFSVSYQEELYAVKARQFAGMRSVIKYSGNLNEIRH